MTTSAPRKVPTCVMVTINLSARYVSIPRVILQLQFLDKHSKHGYNGPAMFSLYVTLYKFNNSSFRSCQMADMDINALVECSESPYMLRWCDSQGVHKK